MKFFGDRRAKPDKLRDAVPLGYAKFLRYERGMALFLCVDARANVHRIEVDKGWIRMRGVPAMMEFIAEAVNKAGAQLAKARRN